MSEPIHVVDWWKSPVGTACGTGDTGTADVAEANCVPCLEAMLADYGFVRTTPDLWSYHPGDHPAGGGRSHMTIERLWDGKTYRMRVEYPGRPWQGDFDSLAEVVDEAGEM